MRQHFPKRYEPFGGDINVKVDLQNYLIQKMQQELIHLIQEQNLIFTSLKAAVYKIDVDKLYAVPVDLSKLSNVVKNEIVRKTVYDKLVAKVNNIDISGFVLKTKHDADKSDLERKISDADKKIPDTSELFRKTDYNVKITEIEGKIPNISSLATAYTLTVVENKIPDVSNLVKKAD